MPVHPPIYRSSIPKTIARRCAGTLSACVSACLAVYLAAWSHDVSADVIDEIIVEPENPAPRLPELIPEEFGVPASSSPLSDANGYLIVGVASRPEWVGAFSEPGSLFLISRFGLPGVELSLEGLDWFADVLPSPIWRAGLTTSFESGRESAGFENADANPGYQNIPDLGFGVAWGAFGGFEMPNNLLPEGLASARVSARTSEGGGRTGHSLTIDVDYFFAATFFWRIGIAAKATIADSAFVDSRFSLSESTAARSGLPEFRASGGLHSVGASVYTIVSVSPKLGLFGRLGRTRLLNDAAQSPIVTRFGDDLQRFAGVGLFYLF